MTRPLLPTDPKAREWEAACVEAAREWLARSRVWGGRQLEDITLEGEAAELQLVVYWIDEQTQQRRKRRFDIWGAQGAAPDGRRLDPQDIGGLIELNLAEFR